MRVVTDKNGTLILHGPQKVELFRRAGRVRASIGFHFFFFPYNPLTMKHLLSGVCFLGWAREDKFPPNICVLVIVPYQYKIISVAVASWWFRPWLPSMLRPHEVVGTMSIAVCSAC